MTAEDHLPHEPTGPTYEHVNEGAEELHFDDARAPAAPLADRPPDPTAGRDVDQSNRGAGFAAHRSSFHAPVTSQPIDTYIGTVVVPPVLDAVSSASPRVHGQLLGRDALEDAARLFVEPPDFAGAFACLRRERVVILVGPADAGHPTAAKTLFHRLDPYRDRWVRNLLLDLDDLDMRLTDALAEGEGKQGFIANLINAGDQPRTAFRRQLGDCHDQLAGQERYLIVAVRADHRVEFERDYPALVHDLGMPDPGTVFRAHLDDRRCEQLIGESWLAARLRNAYPARAARLAKLASEAIRRNPNASTGELLDEIGQADNNWSQVLRKEFGASVDVDKRSLLIALAALEEARPSAVVSGADLLLRLLDYQPDPKPHVLQRPGAVNRLEALAELGVDPINANFTRPEFGRAVLDHVWREHADLRQEVLTWLISLPREAIDLAVADAERLVDRLVDLAGRRGAAEVVVAAARRWAEVTNDTQASSRQSPSLRPLAVRALSAAAVHPRIGQPVRARLYEWAYNTGANVGLHLTVAEVCAGEFGKIFPRYAVTRLKQVAKSSKPVVVASTVNALVKLARAVGANFIVGRLVEWVRDGEAERRRVAAEAFLQITVNAENPARPVGDRASPRRMRSFWRAVFDSLDEEKIVSLVSVWLDGCAVLDDSERNRHLQVLVDATTGQYIYLSYIFHAAMMWPRGEPESIDRPKSASLIRDQVLDYIDRRDPVLASMRDISAATFNGGDDGPEE